MFINQSEQFLIHPDRVCVCSLDKAVIPGLPDLLFCLVQGRSMGFHDNLEFPDRPEPCRKYMDQISRH